MRILEGERVLLKPVEQDDLQFLLDLRWDKETMDFLIHDPISMKSQQQWFEASSKSNDVSLTIFVKESELTRAGTVGLYNLSARHQRATWRVRLHPQFQGKGLALEAIHLVLDYGFNTLNLNKIVSDSFADNTAIVNLSRKLGFTDEGLLKRHYFHKGQFKDAINFGLLRDDYNRRG